MFYITTRSIHESSDLPAPAACKSAKNKKCTTESHPVFNHPPPCLQSGQWRSANRFRRINIRYIYEYMWISERGAYHHTTVVGLMNYWIADCRSVFQSYYQSVRDYYTRITILYIHSALHIGTYVRYMAADCAFLYFIPRTNIINHWAVSWLLRHTIAATYGAIGIYI